MSDNLNIRRPQDPTKVNINESWELEYWSDKFGVSIAKLKEAVSKVGVLGVDVKKYLGK